MIFRWENAAVATYYAHRVLWHCVNHPQPPLAELTEWCDSAKQLISRPGPIDPALQLSTDSPPDTAAAGGRKNGEPAVEPHPLADRLPEPMLTLRQLQALFGYSSRWWRYRVKEGLPRHRWGGHYRYRASEVEAWLADRAGQQGSG